MRDFDGEVAIAETCRYLSPHQARGRARLGQMTATPLNFALLDANRPEVARLIAAMVQARDAVEHRSWSQPQEPSGAEWWADVLADPRARKRRRRTDLAVKRAYYRLADEKREIYWRDVRRKRSALRFRLRTLRARACPRRDRSFLLDYDRA